MTVRDPIVSIVIPTRNGSEMLPTTLRGIARQLYPRELLQTIAVDDGSTDGSFELAIELSGPGAICVRQEASGAAAARNRGVSLATGTLLVFLDDDIELSPGAIAALVEAHRKVPHAIVIGQLDPPPPSNPFERLQVIRSAPPPTEEVTAIDFTHCFTGLLSVGADDFSACGSFQDPTGGTPSWDDIDFGYRAHRLGFALLRAASARAVHHDRSSADLDSLARRWHAASVSVVRLFQSHPGIEAGFSMYRDKLPVDWQRDPWWLVLRKLLRSVASCRPTYGWVRRVARALATSGRLPALARPLCALTISGSIWRGVREGIVRHGALPQPEARAR